MNRFVFGGNGESREYVAGIGMSILFHGVIAFLLVWTPLLKSIRDDYEPFKTAYRVQLVSLEDIRREATQLSTVKASKNQRTQVKPSTPSEPTSPLYPIKKIDIGSTETPLEERGLALKRMTEPAPSVESKVTESIPDWEKLIPIIPMPKPGAQKKREAGGTSTTKGEYAIARRLYYSEVWQAIQKQWALPMELLTRPNLEAVVVITVRRDGVITNARFEKKSGNSIFDDSVWKAIQKANPLPPFPKIYSPPSEEIGIRFRPEFNRGRAKL